jgi:hypothetical protein
MRGIGVKFYVLDWNADASDMGLFLLSSAQAFWVNELSSLKEYRADFAVDFAKDHRDENESLTHSLEVVI